MHVSGEIAHEFSVTRMAIRIGPKGSSMVRGLQLAHVPDADPFSISRKWIANRRWRSGSARGTSAISRKNTHPLLRGNWIRRRRPFQGLLAMELSGLESADTIEMISVAAWWI
jgi:hypothetical protein